MVAQQTLTLYAWVRILVPLPRIDRLERVGFFYPWQRNYDLRSQTYEQSLPSPKAKLADCAYRECGILPCEEILLPLGKSGTIFAHFTPSGKLCIPLLKFGKLACQAQSEQIFATGEYPSSVLATKKVLGAPVQLKPLFFFIRSSEQIIQRNIKIIGELYKRFIICFSFQIFIS